MTSPLMSFLDPHLPILYFNNIQTLTLKVRKFLTSLTFDDRSFDILHTMLQESWTSVIFLRLLIGRWVWPYSPSCWTAGQYGSRLSWRMVIIFLSRGSCRFSFWTFTVRPLPLDSLTLYGKRCGVAKALPPRAIVYGVGGTCMRQTSAFCGKFFLLSSLATVFNTAVNFFRNFYNVRDSLKNFCHCCFWIHFTAVVENISESVSVRWTAWFES